MECRSRDTGGDGEHARRLRRTNRQQLGSRLGGRRRRGRGDDRGLKHPGDREQLVLGLLRRLLGTRASAATVSSTSGIGGGSGTTGTPSSSRRLAGGTATVSSPTAVASSAGQSARPHSCVEATKVGSSSTGGRTGYGSTWSTADGRRQGDVRDVVARRQPPPVVRLVEPGRPLEQCDDRPRDRLDADDRRRAELGVRQRSRDAGEEQHLEQEPAGAVPRHS